jgi:tripartite ATP-independent transporter DctP family solute receptor
MMSLWKPLFGALLFGALVAGPVHAATVLKAGHISPKDSPEGIAADRFAELVKEKTKGEVTIEVFPSEQLGAGTAMIESTIVGNQDIYIGGSPEFERFSSALKALGLNYAVASEQQFQKVLKSPLWRDIFIDPLDKVGLTVISSDWERGPYRVLVSTRAVHAIDDIAGLKIRIAPIDSWRRSWAALGAEPVVLPWTNVYLGLQQGIVNSVTAPINLVGAMRFTEMAKYIARTDEFWQVLAIVMNKGQFEALKPEQRAALREAAEQTGQEFMAGQDRDNQRDIAAWKAQGIEYTVLDLKPGIAKMRPVIEQLEKENFIPAGIYQKLQSVQ